jgi:hypothetical protein
MSIPPIEEGAASGRGGMDDNFTFGLTMTIVGAGGTMLSLWLLSLLTSLLKKIFPAPLKRSATGTEK